MPRILIIDDEDEWCKHILYKPLVRLNLEIETANNHAAALQLIDQYEFDLVVTNVRLDMNISAYMITSRWTELLDAIDRKNAKIIVVTSKAFPPPLEVTDLMRIAFRDFGVVDFLFKEGFNIREYEQVVQSVIKIDHNKSSNGLAQQNENAPKSPLSLSLAHRKQLQQVLADLPLWKLGRHQERYGLLLFIGLPDNYINNVALGSVPEIAAAIAIHALSRIGYTSEVPESTGLGLLIRYLYENAVDIESKGFCARTLLEYNMTTDETYLKELKQYLEALR